MLLASSDDIAWTLNLCGSDTPQAVVAAYLLISSHGATLFIDRTRMQPDVIAYLKTEGVAVNDYAAVGSGLKNYFEYNILMDPEEVNYSLYYLLKQHKPPTGHVTQIIEEPSPVAALR
jgi:Xaa-Pro aminopeptidase